MSRFRIACPPQSDVLRASQVLQADKPLNCISQQSLVSLFWSISLLSVITIWSFTIFAFWYNILSSLPAYTIAFMFPATIITTDYPATLVAFLLILNV